MLSPMYFIIVLAFVFKKSDPGGSANIIIGPPYRCALSALLTRNAEEATERMDAVCKALREMADMDMHMGKTKVPHAQETIHVEKSLEADYSTEDVQKLLTERCEARGAGFTTVRGLNVHQRRHCDFYRRMDKTEYEVEQVLAARGPAEHMFYLLKYKGYGPEFQQVRSHDRMARGQVICGKRVCVCASVHA